MSLSITSDSMKSISFKRNDGNMDSFDLKDADSITVASDFVSQKSEDYTLNKHLFGKYSVIDYQGNDIVLGGYEICDWEYIVDMLNRIPESTLLK